MVEPRRLTALAAGGRAIIDRADPGSLMVALSGGADSAAAAWLARDSGRPVRAVHVHHGALASDMLAAAASGVAAALAVPVEVVEIAVPGGPSYEARARVERHAVLLDRLNESEGEWVVMGHTRDDQVETLLMRLARGTGIDGLAGMARDLHPHLRPLLDSSRSDVRELATLAGLPWRDDPANLDRRHLRNRIRKELIPYMEECIGAAFATSFHRTADVVRRDLEFLDEATATIERSAGPDGTRLNLSHLREAHPAIAARAIRTAIRQLLPPYPPPARVVETALDVAFRRSHRAEIGSLVIEVEPAWLVLRRSDGDR